MNRFWSFLPVVVLPVIGAGAAGRWLTEGPAAAAVALCALAGLAGTLLLCRHCLAAKNRAGDPLFHTVFSFSPDYMLIGRLPDGRIVDVNAGFERLTGYRRDEAIGKLTTDLGLWNDVAARTDFMERLRRSGRVMEDHARLASRDGAVHDVVISASTFNVAGVTHYVAIVRDITADLRTQKELAASEARMKTLIDAAPFPITISRLDDHRCLQANREFERMAGQPLARILGRNLREIGFQPLDAALLRRHTANLIETGRLDNAQVEFVTPTGRTLTLLYSSRVITQGETPAIITIASDITQLKDVEAGLRRTKAELAESEARFAALFESSPVPLGVYRTGNGEAVATSLNAAWYRVFGHAPEPIGNDPKAEAGIWDSQETRRQALAHDRDSGADPLEVWLRRSDRSAILCSISCNAISFGSDLLLLVAFLDITRKHAIESEIRQHNASLEERIAERTRELQAAQAELMQSEKMASLGTLVAGVAHELNTPIGNSLAVATTLTDHTRDLRRQVEAGIRRSELTAYLDNAESGTTILARNLQRAADLIRSFKGIAVDQSSDQRRVFDLDQIVRETLTALHPSLKKSACLIDIDIEAGIRLDSYPGPFEQVLVNLVNNAVLHGFEGRRGGRIEIRARSEGEGVVLTLQDDGAGIAADNLSRIFDPFFTTRMGKGGSGLGLHIVRNIIEKDLGGSIAASSEPGKGTCMTIRLPIQAPERTETPATPPEG